MAVVRASEEAVAKQMQAITQGIQAIVEKAHQVGGWVGGWLQGVGSKRGGGSGAARSAHPCMLPGVCCNPISSHAALPSRPALPSMQLLTFHERKYMTPLWQTECSAYMRRYERANKPVASFLADTQKYVDLKEEVGGWVGGWGEGWQQGWGRVR